MLRAVEVPSVLNSTDNSSNVMTDTGILGSSNEISYKEERKGVNYHHYQNTVLGPATLALLRS